MNTEELSRTEAKEEDLAEENETSEEALSLSTAEEEKIKRLLEMGAHYGLNKSKTNPKMRPFILTTKSGIEVIDVTRTAETLEKAAAFLKDKAKSGGSILLIGTMPASKRLVKEMGERLNLPYVDERWLGGTLTNFKSINGRVDELRKLRTEIGREEKLTKKERLDLVKKRDRLEKLFGGLVSLNRLPAALMILNLGAHRLAAREARRLNIPVVATVNTNTDPSLADFPVPVNDRSLKALEEVITVFEAATEEGRKLFTEAAAAQEKAKEEING